MKDWTGNNKSTFVMLGATNHSDKVRENNDYYATDPHALEIFLDKLKQDGIELHNKIWECACGQGHLSNVLKTRGVDVWSTDLIDRRLWRRQCRFSNLLARGEMEWRYINKPTI